MKILFYTSTHPGFPDWYNVNLIIKNNPQFDYKFVTVIKKKTKFKRLRNFLFTFQSKTIGPVAIRYPKGYSEIKKINKKFKNLKLFKANKIYSGRKIAILSLGTLIENVNNFICVFSP